MPLDAHASFSVDDFAGAESYRASPRLFPLQAEKQVDGFLPEITDKQQELLKDQKTLVSLGEAKPEHRLLLMSKRNVG